MSQARSETGQRNGAGVSAIAARVSVGLRGLRSRIERASGSVAAATTRGRERAAGAAGGVRRSPALRHGLAAWQRDNLEAALALLREAVELAPDDREAVMSLWSVSLLCGRPEVAAPAMARRIHEEAAAGRHKLATEYWMELAEQAPEQLVDARALVRILPELRSRVAKAADAETRGQAETRLLRALRQSVARDAPGLTPGLALRILEQARVLDAKTARRAGAIVLAASDVHESKRRSVERILEQLDAGEGAAAHEAPSREMIEVQPVELGESGLIVLEAGSRSRARVDLRSIEAIAVARVGGLGPEPVLLIDLVLRRAPRARERRVLRMRPDAFDPAAVLSDPVVRDDPLRVLLGALLHRSGAVPMPDPDSALGIEPQRYDSLGDYERAVLAKLSGRPPSPAVPSPPGPGA